ncbi:MAG: uroporphyrinogen decarboxylase [Clostridia bacterium]|nr:uroporphyrinogen decarboxylase [Clostridia bacterium]
MNSYTRIMRAIELKPETIPAAPQVLAWAARIAGVPVRRYVTEAEAMAESLLTSYRRFKYDLLLVGADNSVEAEALGAILEYPEDDYPYVIGRLGFNDLASLRLPEPTKAGRMPVILKACALLRRQVKNQVPVVGKVTGPMTIAGQLLGLEQLLYLIIDAPARFQEILAFTARVSTLQGQALLAAGAHGLVLLEPAGSLAVLPAAAFHSYLVPLLESIFSAYAVAGASIRWLQITGPVGKILPCLEEIPVNLVGLDYVVSPVEAMQLLPGICFIGNVKPYLFVSGPEKKIQEEVQALTQLPGQQLILSSGCELPLDARPEYVTAFMAAKRQ